MMSESKRHQLGAERESFFFLVSVLDSRHGFKIIIHLVGRQLTLSIFMISYL
jgi:hypothetical protein